MENQTAPTPTEQTPVEQPIQVPQQEEPKTKSSLPKALIAVLLVVILAVAGFAFYKKSLTPTTKPTDTATVPVAPSSDPTANWKTHYLTGLGIRFKLPDYFSQMDYPNGNETKGEKGRQFCIQYLKSDAVSFLIKRVLAGGGACSPTYFGLGTTSIDYEAGRMGGFGDLQGYTFENGKYYAKMVLGKKFEIPTELTKEITNPNGIKILRVIGKTEQDMPAFPIAGTPGDGSIGALINLNNNITYSGVSVEMKLDGKLNSYLFDQILSTFKFIDQEVSTVPADWKTYTNQALVGFSLKYPPAWKTDISIAPQTTRVDEQPLLLIHNGKFGSSVDSNAEHTYPLNYVGITAFTYQKTVQDFTNDLVNDFMPETRDNINNSMDRKLVNIDGLSAMSFNEPGAGTRGKVVALSNGKNIVLLTFPYLVDYTNDPILNQIVSSFKFINAF